MNTTDLPDLAVFEEFMGKPLDRFYHNCHAASLAIVRSDLFETARVVRGFAPDITSSQHSWVILSDDVYDPTATIIDPTMWSYMGEEPDVWFGNYGHGLHQPHGLGYRTDFLDVPHTDDPNTIIPLVEDNLSADAWDFYDLHLRGLPILGWHNIFHGGMQGWPSGEILREAYLNSRLQPLIPIDLVGMLTDLNPGGLFK